MKSCAVISDISYAPSYPGEINLAIEANFFTPVRNRVFQQNRPFSEIQGITITAMPSVCCTSELHTISDVQLFLIQLSDLSDRHRPALGNTVNAPQGGVPINKHRNRGALMARLLANNSH
jgi:hypothetical protein